MTITHVLSVPLLGLVACLVGAVTVSGAPQDPTPRPAGTAAAAQEPVPPSLSLLRTVRVPSAVPLDDPDEIPPQHGLDTYVDWDLGTVTQLHDSGAMSTVRLAPNWVFRSAVRSGVGLYAMTMQRASGATYFMENGAWTPIAEPDGEAALLGDYGLFFEVANDEAYAMRYDNFTGRSWLLADKSWEPVAGNIEGWPSERGEGR